MAAEGRFWATEFGTRKIAVPTTSPMTMAVASTSPSLRGSTVIRSSGRCAGKWLFDRIIGRPEPASAFGGRAFTALPVFLARSTPHPLPRSRKGRGGTTNRQRSVAPGRTNSDHPPAEGEVGKCTSLPPRGGGAGGEGALPYDALFRTPPDAASPLSWRA